MRSPLKLGIIASAIVAALAATHTDSLRWRWDVLILKAGGNLPLSWSETLGGLSLCARGDCSRQLVRGEVTLLRYEPQNACPVVWRTPYGEMRSFFEDRNVLRHFVASSWMHDSRAPQISKGDTAIEIGAWLGVFTRFALSRGATLVVAIEPVPQNLACFKQNVAAELASGKVHLVEAAAWDKAVEVNMSNVGPYNPEGSFKGFSVTADGPLQASAVRIDDVIAELQLGRVDFINLDVEGGEPHALAGASETIRRFKPSIVSCIHHVEGDRDRIPEIILGLEPHYQVLKTSLQGYFTQPGNGA